MIRRAAAPAAEGIAMIYPGEGEVLDSSRCRFLIDAPDRPVEIAIDGEGWRSCRRGDGHWWLDWAGLEAGWHQVLVRCEGPRRDGETSLTCRFLVAPRRTDRRAVHCGYSHFG